jgi:hypothetical protein
MLNTTRVLAEKQESEGSSTKLSSSLTKEQQDATIRKWADWILQQRTQANQAKTAGEAHKD